MMRLPLRSCIILLVLCGSGAAALAKVLLDDTWADGLRNRQNPPAKSAWFAADSATLTAAAGSMMGKVGSGPSLWLTHFTPAGTSSHLALGDTITATVEVVAQNVTMNSTSRGLLLGMFNYEGGGTRLTSDGFSTAGANGSNVQGYLLEVDFAQKFTRVPLRLRKRTNLSSSNLMGSDSDYYTLASGGGFAGDRGFIGGTPYTLRFTLTRNGNDYLSWVTFTCRIFGPALDTSITYDDYDEDDDGDQLIDFDTFALRPAGFTESAETLTFSRFKVEGPFATPQPPVRLPNSKSSR